MYVCMYVIYMFNNNNNTTTTTNNNNNLNDNGSARAPSLEIVVNSDYSAVITRITISSVYVAIVI